MADDITGHTALMQDEDLRDSLSDHGGETGVTVADTNHRDKNVTHNSKANQIHKSLNSTRKMFLFSSLFIFTSLAAMTAFHGNVGSWMRLETITFIFFYLHTVAGVMEYYTAKRKGKPVVGHQLGIHFYPGVIVLLITSAIMAVVPLKVTDATQFEFKEIFVFSLQLYGYFMMAIWYMSPGMMNQSKIHKQTFISSFLIMSFFIIIICLGEYYGNIHVYSVDTEDLSLGLVLFSIVAIIMYAMVFGIWALTIKLTARDGWCTKKQRTNEISLEDASFS